MKPSGYGAGGSFWPFRFKKSSYESENSISQRSIIEGITKIFGSEISKHQGGIENPEPEEERNKRKYLIPGSVARDRDIQLRASLDVRGWDGDG